MSKRISAVSGSRVTKSRSTVKKQTVDWHKHFVCRCDVSFRRYAASSAEFAKKWSKIWCFCTPNFWGRVHEIFFLGGAFVNRHHFWPNGQVWLRSHGWSFTYADEIKISATNNYNGLAIGGHNNKTDSVHQHCITVFISLGYFTLVSELVLSVEVAHFLENENWLIPKRKLWEWENPDQLDLIQSWYSKLLGWEGIRCQYGWLID